MIIIIMIIKARLYGLWKGILINFRTNTKRWREGSEKGGSKDEMNRLHDVKLELKITSNKASEHQSGMVGVNLLGIT